MKLGITNKSATTVILGMIFLASLTQLSLLGRGIFSNFQVAPSQVVMPTDAPTPTIAATQSAEVSFKPTRITIDKVGIDLKVVSVPLKNGTWQVSSGVANYAEGTSFVNEKEGNVGIFAHDRKAEFAKIKQILTGYDIMLISDKYKAVYRVESSSVIAPTAVNVFYPTKEPTLTLITCDGTFSEKRYMVRAKLVKIEKVNK